MQQTEWCLPVQVSPSVDNFYYLYRTRYLNLVEQIARNLIPRMLSLFGLAFLLLSFPNPAYAADIQTVLTNLTSIVAPLTLMVLIISYVAGIFYIFKSISMMKKFGMMSQTQHGEFSGPMLQLVVGTALIFLPTLTDVSMASLFGETASIFSGGSVDYTQLGTGSTLLSYGANAGVEQQWANFANVLVLYIQFLGFLSFVKGWFLIAKVGSPGGAQQGGFAKGITHVIGGIVAVNIVGVFNILYNSIIGGS